MKHSEERAHAVLGVGPEATTEEIKQAFRDLAQVWHPDRFVHDERLRAKAEEKFKQINSAYQELSARPSGRAPQPPAPSTHAGPRREHARYEPPRRESPRAGASASQAPRASARASHHARHVRMAIPGVAVMFAGRPGRLINMSITGAKLILDYVPALNSSGVLVLDVQGEVLHLEGRVVRTGSGASVRANGALLACTASMKFENMSPRAQRAIPRFCNLLLAETASPV